jgi:hypothetical protein
MNGCLASNRQILRGLERIFAWATTTTVHDHVRVDVDVRVDVIGFFPFACGYVAP